MMVAVRRRDVASPDPWPQIMLRHQPPDPLANDDDALLSERSADTSVAIGLKAAADRRDRLNEAAIIDRASQFVVAG